MVAINVNTKHFFWDGVNIRILLNKVRALARRQRSVPHAQVMFHLAQPLYLPEAAGLLQDLMNKVTLVRTESYDPCS